MSDMDTAQISDQDLEDDFPEYNHPTTKNDM